MTDWVALQGEHAARELFIRLDDSSNTSLGSGSATLYSITGLSTTLVPTSQINSEIIAAGSTSTGPIFNQIDATAAFDFPPQGSTNPPCRSADGDGDLRGKNGGNGHFHVHHDDCNQQPDSETFSDSNSGVNFQSTQVNALAYDDVAHTITVVGLGTNNGLPVVYTIVATDSTLVPPGVFSITLSDGYTNTGNLLDGSIALH